MKRYCMEFWHFFPKSIDILNFEKCRQNWFIVLGAILHFSPRVLTENKLNDSFFKREILSFVFCNE